MFNPKSKSVIWEDKMQLGSLQDYKLKLQIDIFRHKAQIDIEQLSRANVHEVVFKRSVLEGEPDYKTQ